MSTVGGEGSVGNRRFDEEGMPIGSDLFDDSSRTRLPGSSDAREAAGMGMRSQTSY